MRQFPRRAWLRLRAQGKDYGFRLGRGPFPFLRDNPRITEEWLSAIERTTAWGPEPLPEAGHVERAPEEPVARLLILLSIVSMPFWLIGFLLGGVPAVFFLIMGSVTTVMVATGLLLLRKARDTKEQSGK